MALLDLKALPQEVQDAFVALKAENVELKKQIERISSIALQDELTGLTNRRGFLRSLEKAIAFSKRYKIPGCLVFIDLNKFKEINDTHGHNAGDVVLKTVGQRITRQVRSSDVVARLGGDEFVVLFWQVTEDVARARAGLLMHAICRDKVVVSDDISLEIHASGGVAGLGSADTAEELLQCADKEMYKAKNQTRQEEWSQSIPAVAMQ